MSLSKRTVRDRDYSEILKKYGPLSNADLCKKATEHPHFNKVTAAAIEKDIDRFVKHYENLGIITRKNGRIEWLLQPTIALSQPKPEMTIEPTGSLPSDSQHETVQRLLRGMADGSITLRDKSPHRELNRIKGEIFDEFMADIDLYNYHKHEWPFSGILETRIFNTAIKLRAYGFIEEKEEQPRSKQSNMP
ncbi:MAG TPA: hypothetical protein VGR53_11150 [Nitrososphaerales archaeon]|nr:hypothetical protein [Nitrososphaerales archaeon]